MSTDVPRRRDLSPGGERICTILQFCNKPKTLFFFKLTSARRGYLVLLSYVITRKHVDLSSSDAEFPEPQGSRLYIEIVLV